MRVASETCAAGLAHARHNNLHHVHSVLWFPKVCARIVKGSRAMSCDDNIWQVLVRVA